MRSATASRTELLDMEEELEPQPEWFYEIPLEVEVESSAWRGRVVVGAQYTETETHLGIKIPVPCASFCEDDCAEEGGSAECIKRCLRCCVVPWEPVSEQMLVVPRELFARVRHPLIDYLAHIFAYR